MGILLALLDAGADVNAAYPSGVTALYSAASSGCHEIIRELLRRGTNPQANEQKGKTPGMLYHLGDRETIQMLKR